MTFHHLNLQLPGPSSVQGQAQFPSGLSDPQTQAGSSDSTLDTAQSAAHAKAAATRQLARLASIGSNEGSDLPAPGTIQLTPLPGAPAAKQAAKQAAKPAAKQPTPKQWSSANTGPTQGPEVTLTQPAPNQNSELELEQAGRNSHLLGSSPPAPNLM
ncbi:hypothetical protein C8R48DRAFT_775681 [Suillus tomentosus]|nr:hypothetical protein C8R48DRAFT_775681 [Suillus tomentosus]